MLIADNDNERDTWVLAGTAALKVVEGMERDRATEVTRSELTEPGLPARSGRKRRVSGP